MLGALFKKKINHNKFANVFINGLLQVIEEGFPLVAETINVDKSFVTSPEINPKDDYDFSLIVFAGNLKLLEETFYPEDADKIEKEVLQKLAKVYDIEYQDFVRLIKDYQSYMARLNMPSKVVLYSMSKAVFDKYQLYNFQDEYFKRLQVPNPLLLKRMDQMMENFIWDWEVFLKKYRVGES